MLNKLRVHKLNRDVFWQLIVSRIAWSWQLIRSNHAGLILISPFLHLPCLSQFTRYQDVWCIDWSGTVRPSLYILPPPNFPPNSLLCLSWLNHFLAFSMRLIARHCEVNCQATRPWLPLSTECSHTRQALLKGISGPPVELALKSNAYYHWDV